MARKPEGELRTGFTTGACATAAARAAFLALRDGFFPQTVQIELPRGRIVEFTPEYPSLGNGEARAGVVKDAGDDPDVTHGALILVTLRRTAPGSGTVFRAGEGVGTVTRPGLPVPPGEPAINPVPRSMLRDAVEHGDFEIEIAIPGGEELARQTWNPRLGIVGGLSILGTTGIVRPFSCSAWIASIHRGVDVVRASGEPHAAGCTGATSERAVQEHFGLPDHAMLDMGDFAGGLLRYVARHPIPRLTIGGGLGKLAKLGQGARDLHSSRSRVDFARLAELAGDRRIETCGTVLHAFELAGPPLARAIARAAYDQASLMLDNDGIELQIVATDRAGTILAIAGARR